MRKKNIGEKSMLYLVSDWSRIAIGGLGQGGEGSVLISRAVRYESPSIEKDKK